MAQKKKSSIPQDIQVGLKQLAEATKKDVKKLVTEMKEILDTDENIQVMEQQEAKIRFAWTILASQYSISDGDPFYFRPFSTPRSRKTTKSVVGDLCGVAQKITINDDDDEELGDPVYAFGTFWRDGAKELDKLKKDKVYRCVLRSTDLKYGIAIGGNNPQFKEVNDVELPGPKEFFENEIEPLNKEILIGEMDINEKQYDNDIRVFTVTVLKAETRDDSNSAFYDVVDNSILGHRTHRIWVHPDDLVHGQSSIIKVIGTAENLDNGKVRYTHHFIVPEYSIPRIIRTKPVQDKESVDLNLGADNEEEEEPKEPETKEEEQEEEPEEQPKKTAKKKEQKEELEDDEGDVFAV